ncbi:helix-turn-helix transcriptional regulator [Salinimicrobium sp. GXAS 041]|uniref:helix-turn-helix transcriptional regulator n=1 Tax=Salinimicrobium sp. GXAS 041 TaxID=3400806 RepID=UPI003C749A5B
MEFRIENPHFEEKAFVKRLSLDFRTYTFEEEIIVIDNGQAKGNIRHLQLNGFCLLIQDLEVSGVHSLKISGNTSFFKLHFELEGDYIVEDATNPVLSIPAGHFNIFYVPKPEGYLSTQTTNRKTLDILFTEEFIAKTFGGEYSLFRTRLTEVLQKKNSSLLWEKSRPIGIELQQQIQDIITCSYCGHIKKIYLEARITALLVNLLVEDSSHTAENHAKELSKIEHAGILRVEKYIRKNYRENITIAGLAPIAGLNTSKLKQSFKKVYSTTIFKYITKIRMEKAKEFIKNEGMSISEASYQVGYKNPQHFTVAFKKYYGFLPSFLS